MSLTLAEQYILESFPQSWLHTVEASELPIEDYSTDDEVLEARQESNN
jgi:hypothetical protein